MKYHGYIITAAVLAMAVSCTGKFDNGSGKNIEFRAGVETKAFLNSENLNVADSRMVIYGYENSTALINGVESEYDDAKGWVLDKDYHWASGKSYAFFSYLTCDKDRQTAPDVTMSERKLTLQKTFDFADTDNNFDFCYSDVVYRPSDKPDHSVVNLNLKHLYTAIAFSAHNYTGRDITLKEVSLFGLSNTKSAAILFADSGASVSYAEQDCSWTSGRKLNTDDITIASGSEKANIVGEASTTPQYYMFWPQTSEELAAGELKIVYEQDRVTFTRYALFPQDNDGTADLGWPAGTKRMMQLAFRKDKLTLKVASLPWDYSEPTIKYDEEVDLAETLQFDSATCTVDEANRKVYFKGSSPIRGTFKFISPAEATWFVSKEGDYDVFEIDDAIAGRYGDGVDRNYGSVDTEAGNSFTIYPKNAASGRDYSIQLTFSIRYPNGESYCIDDKIQPDGKWTIILTK